MIDNWVDEIIEDGVVFIKEFNTLFNNVEAFLGEVRTQLPLWEADKEKWKAIVTHIFEVE